MTYLIELTGYVSIIARRHGVVRRVFMVALMLCVSDDQAILMVLVYQYGTKTQWCVTGYAVTVLERHREDWFTSMIIRLGGLQWHM